MDPLDFFEEGQLLEFLHRNKTEISFMEKPHTFIMQLRDHNLIREDKYKKLIRMKRDNMNSGLYDELDWLEQHTPQHIRLFWECVFKESILSRYPKLLMLRNSLMDGSFQFCKLPQKVEKEEKKEAPKGGEEEEEEEEEEVEEEGTRERKRGKKRRKKQRSGSVPGEEEQPGTSSSSTPAQRKRKKPTYSSPLKKGDKKDIWTWGLYKVQIPVTCGDKEGNLNRAKLAKGEKCIVVQHQWFTPSGFEEYGGRKAYKNWKLSIRCMDTPLSKLLQDGHLTCPGYKGKRTKTKKSLFPPIGLDDSDTGSSSASDSGLENEGDEDEEEDLTDAEKDASRSRASPENATAFMPMASTSTQTAVPSVIKQEVNQEGHTGEGDQEEPGSSRHNTVDKRVFNVKCGAMNGTLYKHRFASGTCGKSIRTDECWFSPVEFVREALEQPDAPWKKEIQWEGRPLSVLIGETKALRIHSVLCKCSLCRPEAKDLEDQENDDECFICRSDRQEEGERVECDGPGCPRTFHQRCHLPNVEDEQLRDGREWYCTFCVWKMYDYHEQSTHKTVLSSQISRHLLECQYLLLALYREDMDKFFATDPTIHVRNYTTVVKFPMWLDKVAEKLQQNRYQTVSQFVCDVLLIFTNCAKFNRDNAEFRDLGNRLKELFDSEFTKVFRIQQDNAQ